MKLGWIICAFKDHDWIYSYTTYFGQAFRNYYEKWEERHCDRCGKSQERKVFESERAI